MLITENYKKQIHWENIMLDRIINPESLPGWHYAEGMTAYLYSNNIKIFDYPMFAEPLNEQI